MMAPEIVSERRKNASDHTVIERTRPSPSLGERLANGLGEGERVGPAYTRVRRVPVKLPSRQD